MFRRQETGPMFTNHLTWDTLPAALAAILGMPQNAAFVGRFPSLKAAVDAKVREIRSGSDQVPQPREFRGPIRLYRAAGPRNNPFGEWWFSEDQLAHIERISRLHAPADRREVIRACLREVTAVTTEWNAMTEIWCLALPAGATLTGLVSTVKPQPKFQAQPAGPKLVGGAEQVYFVVKNPLWVTLYA
jgi:hypothetical protein